MEFIVDLWLDGHETEEEMEKACIEFMDEQLNITASSVSIVKNTRPQICEATAYKWAGQALRNCPEPHKCQQCADLVVSALIEASKQGIDIKKV